MRGNMSNLDLLPRIRSVNANLNLPGSKSIANRVLLLAAIAHGTSVIHNVPDVSEDVMLMLDALQMLGVNINKITTGSDESGSSSYEIEGCGGEFRIKDAEIFCGNSGTTIRFLGAMLSLMPGRYCLTGIERMKERPINDMIVALEQLGAKTTFRENKGFPPFQTSPYKDNQANTINLSGKLSSQYLTGLLMALPVLGRDVRVHIFDELISKPYVDITVALLAKFGCMVETIGNDYIIHGGSTLHAIEYTIEPDASSASYFLALGALDGKVRVYNLSADSLQGDKKFASVLHKMGAKVDYMHNSIMVRKQGKLKAINQNMQQMPDVAMTLATLALFAEGTSTISGISSWKVKETDRLQAMYNELTKLGAIVAITDDSITITPPDEIKQNVAIDTYNDHRMAMCFSLVAAHGQPVTINNYECVGKTFANYFDVFKKICY
jgi:3-phosphoshikimate 1-carboxyvinyltransferase